MEMETTDNTLDIQVGGNHYKDCKIQPIEFIHANKLDFISGNIVKYASRHKRKNKDEDIKKIIHYALLSLSLDYGYDSEMINNTLKNFIHEKEIICKSADNKETD
jgi:hypothetical protein